MRRLSLALALTVCALPGLAGAGEGPWRLGEAVGLPQGLHFEATHRWRFEYLDDAFRAGREGHENLTVVRTTAHARWQIFESFGVGAELADSRAWGNRRQVRLSTGLVDTAALLRAYAEFSRDGVLGGRLRAQGGRMTMDVGDRRLVARNRFRNTINNFTGVDVEWTGAGGSVLRGFYTLPVQRYPVLQDELRDADYAWDQESFDLQFWGLYGNRPLEALGLDTTELFFYGLHERDRHRLPSRNRQIYTTGFRLKRDPSPSSLDFELESVIQFGESRASVVASEDLDHLAHFHHAELGYLFDAPCAPRLALQYDYASGDEDPGDGRNNRFDTLFGARRFDFGPTSLYGAFARSNINSPGLRFQVEPLAWLSAFAAYRAFWLASKDDFWTTAGLIDLAGDTNGFVGHQVEARLRLDVLPGNLRLEGGVAHLFRGDFARHAAGAPDGGDPTYLYAQASLAF